MHASAAPPRVGSGTRDCCKNTKATVTWKREQDFGDWNEERLRATQSYDSETRDYEKEERLRKQAEATERRNKERERDLMDPEAARIRMELKAMAARRDRDALLRWKVG